MFIKLVMASNHLILCCPVLLQSIFPSIRIFFKWVSSLHGQVAKVLELQFQYQSFQWIFRTDFLLGGLVGYPYIQGTLKSLHQHHSSKASFLWQSAFFLVQLPHPLEKEVSTYSSILAWKILGTGEPGGLLSMKLQTVGYDWSNLAAAAAHMHTWLLEEP